MIILRLKLYTVLNTCFNQNLGNCSIYVKNYYWLFFRNMIILKQQLSELWEQENHLTLVPGYTGNIAKVIQLQLFSNKYSYIIYTCSTLLTGCFLNY